MSQNGALTMSAPAKSLLLLTAALLLGACSQPRFDTPVVAYQSFHRLVQRQEYEQAWQALSEPSRQALAARSRALSEASQGGVKDDPMAFFFTNAARVPDVTDVTLLSEEGERATVRVLTAAGASEVRMVREPSGWRLDLTGSL
jgi:hypothetical protein